MVSFVNFVDITGDGKRPETWATVVTCLKEVGLKKLADKIEDEYPDSADTGETPPTHIHIPI